jgi:hypothetical protein
MPRYRSAPLTVAAIWQDGPPVRMRDLQAITGLTAQTIRGEITDGHLAAHRLAGVGYWLIHRDEARRWLARLGFEPRESALSA